MDRRAFTLLGYTTQRFNKKKNKTNKVFENYKYRTQKYYI